VRPDLTTERAVAATLVLMDPAVHRTLVREHGWTRPEYANWIQAHDHGRAPQGYLEGGMTGGVLTIGRMIVAASSWAEVTRCLGLRARLSRKPNLLRHMILPAVALGTIPLAVIARITRSSLLDVLGQDYVRTAHAKGLKRRLVMTRHALRNAMLPVITVIGLSLGGLLGGAVLTETIFGLAGVGLTVYESIGARDYVVIQGFTLVIAVGFMVVNLLVDVSYAYLDPRIRLS